MRGRDKFEDDTLETALETALRAVPMKEDEFYTRALVLDLIKVFNLTDGVEADVECLIMYVLRGIVSLKEGDLGLIDYFKKAENIGIVREMTERIEEMTERIEANHIVDETPVEDINPCKQACDIIKTLNSLSSIELVEEPQEIIDLVNLCEKGSRFAEEVYYQSSNFETIKSILCSSTSSCVAKYCSLQILIVVSQSGNRNLIKLLLKDYQMLQCLQSFIHNCTPKTIKKLTPIRFHRGFSLSLFFRKKYHTVVLAEQ